MLTVILNLPSTLLAVATLELNALVIEAAISSTDTEETLEPSTFANVTFTCEPWLILKPIDVFPVWVLRSTPSAKAVVDVALKLVPPLCLVKLIVPKLESSASAHRSPTVGVG